MSIFSPFSTRQVNLALLVLRIAVGLTLAAHGWQKVFGFGFSGVAGSFAGMGVPLAPVMGPLVSVLELLGGFALAAGLLTRVVAPLLALDMLGAALLVHLPNGFFAPKGAELVLTLMAATLTLAITGAGAFSVDSKLARSR